MSLPVRRPGKTHKIFATTDVIKHDKLDDMWSASALSSCSIHSLSSLIADYDSPLLPLIVSHNGLVYDVTKFIADHPGSYAPTLPRTRELKLKPSLELTSSRLCLIGSQEETTS